MSRHCIRTAALVAAASSWLCIACAHAAESDKVSAWTAEQLEQGFVAFGHHNLQLLEATDVPTPEAAANKTVTCSLAQGEYESVQIGIHALRRGTSRRKPFIYNVQLTVESDIPVRIFRRIDHEVHELLDTYVNKVPAETRTGFLDESDQIAAVAIDTTAPFWLTFHAPPDARPGLHQGKIRVTADLRSGAQSTVELDLNLQVHPFLLERARVAYWPFFYFDFINGQGLPKWVIDDERWIEALYRDMAEHSHTSVSFYGYPGPGIDLTGELPPPENPYTSVFLPLAKKAGLTSPDIPVICFVANTGPPPSRGGPSIEQQNRAMEWMHAECRRRGWPELVGYGPDEPGYPSPHSASLEEENGALRQISKRQAAAICARGAYGFGDYFDIWIMESGHITAELAAEAERLGAEIWTYAGGGGAKGPLKERYFAGLFVWAKKARGHTTWHHYAQTGYKMIWMRQGDDGPMPSVGWEARRDGIDDLRYLQMLEDRVAANPAEPAAALAGGWLEGLRSRIHFAPDPNQARPGVPMDLEEYEWIRNKAAEYIQQLPPPPPGFIKPKPVTRLKDEGQLFRDQSIQACISALEDDDLQARRAAALALMERGAEAAPAAAALVEQLDVPEVRIPALRALEKIGPAAAWTVPQITALYSHPDPFIRLAATFALRGMGPSAAAALQVAMLDEFAALAEAAGSGLGSFGPAAEPAVPTLIKMLEMPDPYQFVALRTIEQIGPGAAPAMPVLLDQWAERMKRHRSTYFLNVFLAIGPPHANGVVPLLEQFIEKYAYMDTVHGNKATAYYALCRFRGAPQDLEGLVDMIENPPADPVRPDRPVTRDVAAWRLTQLGPDAKAAVPRIRKLVAEQQFDQSVADRLNSFLAQVGE